MKRVLAINGGSSSIKLALFDATKPPTRVLAGKIDRIGVEGATFSDNNSGE